MRAVARFRLRGLLGFPVPFADELARGLAVVAYDGRWPGDFEVLARRLEDALGPAAVRVSHVGSTSVPGLAARDCIDVQVEVRALDEGRITGCPGRIDFRLRPEPWNRAEPTPGGPCPKLVFARQRVSGPATSTS